MCSALYVFKNTFTGYQKSNFLFPKFHLTLHYTWFVKEYGSTHSMSTTHGKFHKLPFAYALLTMLSSAAERLHKAEIKPLFPRTSQKKRTAYDEMSTVLDINNYLQDVSEHVGLELSRQVVRRDPTQRYRAVPQPVRDEFCFGGISYTLPHISSPTCVPHRARFPSHEETYKE